LNWPFGLKLAADCSCCERKREEKKHVKTADCQGLKGLHDIISSRAKQVSEGMVWSIRFRRCRDSFYMHQDEERFLYKVYAPAEREQALGSSRLRCSCILIGQMSEATNAPGNVSSCFGGISSKDSISYFLALQLTGNGIERNTAKDGKSVVADLMRPIREFKLLTKAKHLDVSHDLHPIRACVSPALYQSSQSASLSE
jgi:hypothetical protein